MLPVLISRAAGVNADFAGVNLADIKFTPHPNAALPLNAELTDEMARQVTLGDTLGREPGLLLFVWYKCDKLCHTTLNMLATTVSMMPAGDAPNLIALSIDSRETAADAYRAKQTFIDRFPRLGLNDRWHFLTAPPGVMRRFTDIAGYQFRYDARHDQFIHPAGLIVLTPDGRISSYLFGAAFQPDALESRLKRAAANQVKAAPPNPLLLLCYGYDDTTGRYTFAVMKALRLLAVVSVLALIVAMLRWRLLEKKQRPETED
jgi:protein SCO1/2